MGWEEVKKELIELAGPTPQAKRIESSFSWARQRREQARMYLEGEQYERAFISLLQFSDLVSHGILQAPEGKTEANRLQRKLFRKQLVNALDMLESLDALLQKKYEHVEIGEEEEEEQVSAVPAFDETKETKESVSSNAEEESVHQTLSSETRWANLRIPSSYQSERPVPPQPSAPPPPQTSSTSPKLSKSTISSFAAKQRLSYPADLISAFMKIAQPNTSRDIETCGILTGSLGPDSTFHVTHLIIPRQQGTANTVVTESEEMLIQTQLELGLITLGWIHTHPSQDCFMSSVDLHTHYGYQVMLPEAIAIVVAPSKRDQGCFSISDKGMKVLAECGMRGFHHHPRSEGVYGIGTHAYEESSKLSSRIKVIRLDQ